VDYEEVLPEGADKKVSEGIFTSLEAVVFGVVIT
jgi:hypothetical protein